jgi:3-oxoacyl-[acyl-carrier-protein] synthase II
MYEAVITGLGPVAPNGVGKDAFWEALRSGKSGIRAITKFDVSNYPCKIAGEIPIEYLDDKMRELPEWLPDSMSCKLSVIATLLALEDAGLNPEDIIERNSAVFMGVSTTDMEVVQREYTSFIESGAPRPDSLISAFPHTPAVVVSHFLKSFTNVVTISTACTSGLNSIDLAAKLIIRGEADLVIAGGVDTPLSPLVLSGFCSAGMVPTSFNLNPDRASRPFDEKRQGGILSEGAGVIILEEKASALKRNARIYASYEGGGFATSISPSWMNRSMVGAMQGALNNANLQRGTVDLINACAPGDPVIDQVETEAIKNLFGTRAYNIPVCSLKSMIGNPGAAAGPLQVIASALSMEKKYITPTINLDKPSKDCDLDYVPQQGRIARVNSVMINLRGFGGGITSIIIKNFR